MPGAQDAQSAEATCTYTCAMLNLSGFGALNTLNAMDLPNQAIKAATAPRHIQPDVSATSL